MNGEGEEGVKGIGERDPSIGVRATRRQFAGCREECAPVVEWAERRSVRVHPRWPRRTLSTSASVVTVFLPEPTPEYVV